MKMFLKVSIPVEKGNELVRKGTLGTTLAKILEEIKPEAAYFAEVDGKRTGLLFVDLKEASGIPALAEPFFLALDARIEFHPVMTPADLEAAMPALTKAAKKYGK